MRAFVTIQGAGADKTVVQWGDTAQTPGPRGQPLGTYGSATFAVNSPYFIAKNITFKVSQRKVDQIVDVMSDSSLTAVNLTCRTLIRFRHRVR